MTIGLTPYVTPAMLLASNYGISWGTFPKSGASAADQIAAQLQICATLTSEMDAIANQMLRATIDVEREFGPDLVITMLPNGWARFRMSSSPIARLVGARVSPSSANPPAWSSIAGTSLILEHSPLPATGTIVPAGSGPLPAAALIPPGYVSRMAGRKGYYVEVTALAGFPVAGIDVAAAVAATSLHVDDVTGWWDPDLLAGARGTIYDPPWREDVVVAGMTPDVAGAISGPGTLTLTTGLRFGHTPSVGGTTEPDQRILVSAMPDSLIQAGLYLATHYGLIRGATSAIVQTARGAVQVSGMKSAMDWYEQAKQVISRYGRVW